MPHATRSPSPSRLCRTLSCTALFTLAALPVALIAQTVIPGTTTNNTNSTPYNILSAGPYILNAGTTYQLRSATDGHGIRINAANVTLSLQGTLVTESLLSTASDNSALRVTGAGTSGILVNVGSVSNTGALILSKGNDAVKFTGVGISAVSPNILNNWGTLRSEGRINASGGSPETYTASDGITMGTNTTLNNYNTVSGARHGVDAGDITGVTVNNSLGGSLIGRNGSGIGADTTSATAASYIVNNSGLIRGDYAGAGNIFNRQNVASLNGDGDGIDIDGAATINNFATGQIISTGAGGFDSGGRANTSDGLALGGGVVNNDGLIRGAGVGIVVNNDANVSRSGVTAATISNALGASIEGQSGYAIRIENKLGDARDNDTITNAGTIIGNGSIPNPSDVITVQSGAVDGNSSGTLDGVTYTGTGSARFIKGDGSAIQTGEGADILTNTGTITGNTGRAVNMEGGNDTLNHNGGTITGAINGGTGTNTLNLGAGASHGSATQNFQNVNVISGTGTLAGVVSGTTLTKGGNGTLVLSGANDYTGTTTVSAGKLLVDNVAGSGTGSGNVLVNAGGTLGGIGFISGPVTVDGIIAPGNSIGTLHAGNNVTWNGSTGNNWEFELGAGSLSDLFNIDGDFLKGAGGDFNFNFLNTGEVGTYVLVNWNGSTNFSAGNFNYANLGAGLGGAFAFNGSQLEFTTTAIPEPATTGLITGAGVLSFALYLRRRRTVVA